MAGLLENPWQFSRAALSSAAKPYFSGKSDDAIHFYERVVLRRWPELPGVLRRTDSVAS
jgi:hypothetical protein